VLTLVLKLSVVCGTSISLFSLSGLRVHCDIRPVSMTKIHASLWPLRCRWVSYFAAHLWERHLVATWVLEVVPSGMPHRGLDMSPRDMHLVAVSVDVVGSERSEPLAGVSHGPLGCCGLVWWAANTSYTSPPLVGLSCLLLSASSLPVDPWATGLSPNRCPGTGWLAGSDRLSELQSSSSFLWLTGSCGDSQEDRG
jgi:hypothetical protein